jgi:hypothetical protein
MAFERASWARCTPVETVVVGEDVRDPKRRFLQAYGISPTGASLVRPDGFVAWRSRRGGDDRDAVAERVLASILALPAREARQADELPPSSAASS